MTKRITFCILLFTVQLLISQEKLIKSERLGIYAMSVTDVKKANFKMGFLITGYTDNSFGKMTSIKPGDIIFEVNGKAVDNPMQISNALKSKNRIELKLLSQDKIKVVHIQTIKGGFEKAKVDKDVEFVPNNQPWLGVHIKNAAEIDVDNIKGVKNGIYIKRVIKDSPADKAGLKVGDVILKIDDVEMKNTKDLFHFLNDKREDVVFTMNVFRKGLTMNLEITPTVRPEFRTDADVRAELKQLRAENKALLEKTKKLEEKVKDKDQFITD